MNHDKVCLLTYFSTKKIGDSTKRNSWKNRVFHPIRGMRTNMEERSRLFE
ncbi:hypothetical protein LEP1GSC103_0215 [Leptospira borgpetersenii serovar Javanica str. UI 09931]|uniref:Uncharacterized protein n=5 Tax=Leptospira borgpetersenii TaxID=174 RepID=M3FEN8_LEPBO|nr:hypothetical protein LBBP_03399 [Leptospira borgpetersenii serovar Ballum]EKP14731.1 hypothetical protein LEP1GSC128_1741 [Leptospira borgpetersenii str. 200801926]EKQ92750.1 hypothetical protein LEP1GSC101_2615 [Leptospira borgpetersenii str. UI 09149]EKQ99958.1 hypothetical protein LEP1GSC121_1912 [Leptospira borgpetersenii serovar Castellonis str. 200801910]EMG00343.1 hypothetical protein LEP1GSC123_2449 [Leptospira borgpetersenii str. 200701203]EMK14205.1 hypothetical protein LEP1GSC066